MKELSQPLLAGASGLAQLQELAELDAAGAIAIHCEEEQLNLALRLLRLLNGTLLEALHRLDEPNHRLDLGWRRLRVAHLNKMERE